MSQSNPDLQYNPVVPNERATLSQTGNFRIIGVRMEQLKLAIDQRDWQAVEWEYDRVLRAIQKAGQKQAT